MFTQEQLAAIAQNRQRAQERLLQRQKLTTPTQLPSHPQQHTTQLSGVISTIRSSVPKTTLQKPTSSTTTTMARFSNNTENSTRPQKMTSSLAIANPVKQSDPAKKKVTIELRCISETTAECLPLPFAQHQQPSLPSYCRKRARIFMTKSLCQEMNEFAIENNYFIKWNSPAKTVISLLLSKKEKNVDDDLIFNTIEPKINDALLPFQRECVKFGVQRDGRLLIADDMGLGKTLQSIAIATYYRLQWPLLVICPSAVRTTCEDAIRTWVPSIKENIKVIYSGKNQIFSEKVVIVSYDLVSKISKDLQRKQFQVVIADESHVLKNHDTLRAKAVLPILQAADRCILLSGTPALRYLIMTPYSTGFFSRPSELFTQLKVIAPKIFNNYKDFGLRYCAGKLSHFGWDFSGSSNLEEMQIILRRLMIRRMKKDVLHDLPPKHRHQIFLDIGINDGQQGGQMANDLESMFAAQNASILEMWRKTSTLKQPAVLNYVRELLTTEKRKFLVFAHHKEMLNVVEDLLDQYGESSIRIDGSTGSMARQELTMRFQTDPSCRVAVLSITAAGVGLTLTKASLVIFAELYWQPGILIQAEDRAHRLGQKDPVEIRYLVARNTLDDRLWPLLLRKMDVLEQVGFGKNELAEVIVPERATDINKAEAIKKEARTPHSQTDIRSFFSQSSGSKSNMHVGNDTEDNLFDDIDENALLNCADSIETSGYW